MLKKLLLFIAPFSFCWVQAQTIAEVQHIRIYEHHSTDMTGVGFGSSANGAQSGYDFVKLTYANSFDPNTNGPFTKGEEKEIDMVEHNGPFGTNGNQYHLGFTAGTSTIWGGDIKGNGTTKWHKVVAGVTGYENLKNYVDLKSFYDSTKATVNIEMVQKDDVFIGKIRNTDLYVMIRCTAVGLPKGPPNGGDDNNYFDFDYKFGSKDGVTGLSEISKPQLQVYPNPTKGNLYLQCEWNTLDELTIELHDIMGRQIVLPTQSLLPVLGRFELNTQALPRGLYTILIRDISGTTFTQSFLKED
jgi:hypothetical protein